MTQTKGTAREPLRLVSKQAPLQSSHLPPQSKPVSLHRAPPPESTRVLRSHIKSNLTSNLAPTSEPIAARTRRRRRAGADPWIPRRRPKTRNARPRLPPPTHFTCRICTEEKPIETFIKWVPTHRPIRKKNQNLEIPFSCIAHLSRHPRRKNDPVCKECIGQSMTAKLDMLGARKVAVGCLEPGCETRWDLTSITRYFPAGEPFDRYNSSMLNVYMEDMKAITCVKEGCSAVGVPDPMAPGYPEVACHTCGTRMCATCLIPWHTDLTCAESAAKQINDKMSDPEKDTLTFMQKKDGKRCPNCYLVIEKDGGCDSMYCMGCRTYFNWATAASAIPGKNKAIPIQHGQSYWNPNPGPVLCEMESLVQTNGNRMKESKAQEAAGQGANNPGARLSAAANATAPREINQRDQENGRELVSQLCTRCRAHDVGILGR